MKKFPKNFIAAAFVLLLAAGCASAPSRFYTLAPVAVGEGATNNNFSVLVGPVSIPAEVNRPQFTVQLTPNQVAVDEFNRWAAPLSDNIARVVAVNLSVLLGTPRVAVAPFANFAAADHVTISLQRFESMPGQSVLVDAVWVVRPPAGGTAQSGRTVVNERVVGDDFDAIAAAHSRALGKISRDIAAAIRSLPEAKPGSDQ